MRKSTKAVLIIGTGAVLSLGFVFGNVNTNITSQAYSGSVKKKVEIELPTVPTPEQIAAERHQEEANAQVQELIAEGSKTENMTVDGVASGVKGLYYLDSIQGVSITPDLNNSYNKGNTTVPEVTVYETSAEKSPQAYQCVKEVVSQYNSSAVVGPSVNIQTRWPEGEQDLSLVGDLKIGISDEFKKDGATYAVAAGYPGGFYQIYKDTDDNPDTISFRAPVNYTDNIVMYTLVRIG